MATISYGARLSVFVLMFLLALGVMLGHQSRSDNIRLRMNANTGQVRRTGFGEGHDGSDSQERVPAPYDTKGCEWVAVSVCVCVCVCVVRVCGWVQSA